MQITYMNYKNNKKYKEVKSFTSVSYKKNRLNEFKIATMEGLAQVNTSLLKYRKYRLLISLGYAAILTVIPSSAFASSGDGGVALLKLMQQFSFWIGIGVVIWGIVEAQLDLPGWKSRIFKGIGGYVGVLLVPMLFIALRENLQIDVWSKLSK